MGRNECGVTAGPVALRYDESIMPLGEAHRPLYEVKAGLFKGLAHPIRIQILELLSDGGEHSVSALQERIGLEPSHLSQHLAVLRRHQLVTSQRRASHVFYQVATTEVVELLAAARRFLTEVLQTQRNQLANVDDLPSLPG